MLLDGVAATPRLDVRLDPAPQLAPAQQGARERQEDERDDARDETCDEDVHDRAPGSRASRPARTASSPRWKKSGGKTTPFAASFGRKCGFRPVESSASSSREASPS